MSENKNNVLEQTENVGSIKGALSEKNLEPILDDKRKEVGIRGTLAISTGDSVYEVQVYTMATTASGKANPMYPGIKTVMNDYVDKAHATEEHPADTVHCTVSLRINDFVSKKSGELITSSRLNLNRINRKPIAPEDYEAKMILEGFILDYKPEIEAYSEEEEETGRLIVELGVVGYNGDLMPFNLIVPDDIADDFENFYEVNDTAQFDIDIVNKTVGKKAPTHESGFGKVEEKGADISSGYTIQELQIFKGSNAYDEEAALDEDLIAEALNEREIYLAELLKKEQAKNGQNQKSLKRQPKSKTKKETLPF